tara:strand:+ start:621 stop:815 length:195 start_codon:yes stop_codon:yes gene_type:complete
MTIPQSFIETNLARAKGAMIFGVSLEDLTREELMACVAAGWSDREDVMKEAQSRYDLLIGRGGK